MARGSAAGQTVYRAASSRVAGGRAAGQWAARQRAAGSGQRAARQRVARQVTGRQGLPHQRSPTGSPAAAPPRRRRMGRRVATMLLRTGLSTSRVPGAAHLMYPDPFPSILIVRHARSHRLFITRSSAASFSSSIHPPAQHLSTPSGPQLRSQTDFTIVRSLLFTLRFTLVLYPSFFTSLSIFRGFARL